MRRIASIGAAQPPVISDRCRYVPPEMIAFGCPITDHALYEAFAEPGIRRVAEPDSEILALGSAGLGDASIFRNYNLLIEEAAKLDGPRGPRARPPGRRDRRPGVLREGARRARRTPRSGSSAAPGAIGVRNIAWWDGSVTLASFSHRYEEYGGGEILGVDLQLGRGAARRRGPGEVDVIDGFMMALPPWFIENIRFDESLGQLHGYDFDVCQQVRAAGKKVWTEHIRVIHHHSLELIGDVEGWIAAHMRVAEKWDGRLSPVADDPRRLEGPRALGRGAPRRRPDAGERRRARPGRGGPRPRASAPVDRAERELAPHQAAALAEVAARGAARSRHRTATRPGALPSRQR